MKSTVGIDDLYVYGSTLAVDASEIGRARGTERELKNLRLVRRSLPPSFEDPITLAVNAATPLLDCLDPPLRDRHRLLLVATESGIDFGKPVSSYVHRYLGLSEQCGHVEVKHACYGGTMALRLAAAWVTLHPEERALVIMTDMSRRLFHDPAEPAEGAGAVAMVVASSPRILALDPWIGVAAQEFYDIRRPTPTLETGDTALSLAAYLDLFESAWASYATAVGPGAFDALAHVVYHAPVRPLVEQAHALLVETNRPDASRDEIAASFARLVEPSFRYCRELGNIYGGTLYAALAGLIDGVETIAPGSRVGLYSYGSGSCAEFFSGTVGPEAHATLSRHVLGDQLARRRLVSISEYERTVIDTERGMTEKEFDPDRTIVPGLFDDRYRGHGLLVLESVKNYYRAYGRA
jgi:3-hydroxy-3-methylglutaryl CoA synthase